MTQKNKHEEEIFQQVIQLGNLEEQKAYIDEACGEDRQLRASVLELMKHHNTDSILDSPALESLVQFEMSHLAEKAGDVVGRYKLLEQIGEGGMAVVYMAQQEQPVKRKVALKIIKLGMDTKQVIARFEAERQALAMMDHPNIAKVLYVGATETGRPYFVMELVKGIPITQYCEEHNLTIRQRLELFIQVCNGIQHAHQKGVIHRDIKPTNILIARHDGMAVPKIIDFGISKAVNQRLTEKTLFTNFSQLIGTPAYMSPEQAEWSDLDVDTRTDVYSLGVLLYELLTGSTPLDQEKLGRTSYSDIQKAIREEEPVRPSTRLHRMGAMLTEVATHRKTRPESLERIVRGDLDWIILKALEKDRNRRYDTATEFASDIECYLHNEPVKAAAPSIKYKLKKFVMRNRVGVLAGALVVSVLIIGIMGTTFGLFEARRQKQQAESDFGNALKTLESMSSYAWKLGDMPDIEYVQLDLLTEVLNLHEGFLEKRAIDPQVRRNATRAYGQVADVYQALGLQEEAEQAYHQAITLGDTIKDEYSDDVKFCELMAGFHLRYGIILGEKGERQAARKMIHKAQIKNPGSPFGYACQKALSQLDQKESVSGNSKVLDWSSPTGLGLVILRVSEHPKAASEADNKSLSWNDNFLSRSNWHKQISPPAGSITVVVPNRCAETEGEGSESRKTLHGYGFRKQEVYPYHEFNALSQPMYLTKIAFRPDKFTANNTILFKDMQIHLSSKKALTNTLSEVFETNHGGDKLCVYDDMAMFYVGGYPGMSTRNFSSIFNLREPFLYYKANQNDLLFDVKTATGPHASIGLDLHGDLLGTIGVYAIGHDSKEGLLCPGKWIVQFTFVPVSTLENDPVVALEVVSDTLVADGPVGEIQLHVRAIKQSGLAEDVTEKASYESQVSSVAEISTTGLITPDSPGASKIYIRYTDPLNDKLFTEFWVIEAVRIKKKGI